MGMIDPEDAKLAGESRAGCIASFDQLVHRHHGKVFGFLLTLTKHRQDAEDLTQETFIRAWKKIDRYDPGQPIIPWLFTIARRLSIDMLRKRKPVPAAEPEAFVLPPAHPSAPDLWRTAELHLSGDAFSALWLHYRDDLPIAEIGRVLGKKEGAVKVLLHRARKSLAENLRHQPITPPHLTADPPPTPSIWNQTRATS